MEALSAAIRQRSLRIESSHTKVDSVLSFHSCLQSGKFAIILDRKMRETNEMLAFDCGLAGDGVAIRRNKHSLAAGSEIP